MTLAPIVLFVYNRPIHTIKTVEALLKNNLASDSELYVFSDQAKTGKDVEAVKKTRTYVEQINGFKNVTCCFHPENKGLASSIIQGVSEVFEKHDKVIVLEDDLETSPNFLSFMNNALENYSPKNIWSIAGYSPNIKVPVGYKPDTYLAHRNCSWGWATWKQNWEKTDWNVCDFNEFIVNPQKRTCFERGGNDLSVMLLKQQQHVIDSWSIRFNYAAYKNNLPTVYPVKSFIKNTGVDGSGTNMKRSGKFDSKLNHTTTEYFDFCPGDFIDEQIAVEFRKFYNTSLYRKLINWYKIRSVILKKQ